MRSEELVDGSVPWTFESGDLTPAVSVETIVASAAGQFDACDAWFRVPSGWPTDLAFRVYARLGEARVLLREVDLADTHTTSAGGFLSGIAVSVRGRPCTAFELAVLPRTALSGTGRFTLQAWRGSTGPRTVGAGAVATQLRAEEALVAVQSGGRPVVASGDAAGRVLVAGGGTLSTPGGGVLSVQGPAAGGPTFAVSTPLSVKASVNAVGTTTNILTLRSTASKRVEVRRLVISYQGNQAAAEGRLVLVRSSTTPSGGTAATAVPFNSSQSSATATSLVYNNVTAITWAPTDAPLLSLAMRGDSKGVFSLEPDAMGQPITLRTTGETLGVRFITETLVAGQFFQVHVTIHFIEI